MAEAMIVTSRKNGCAAMKVNGDSEKLRVEAADRPDPDPTILVMIPNSH
jgi:hypothetical protein